MMWATEAWIISKGHEPNTGNGWSTIRAQFIQLAPTEIREPVLYCVGEAVMLDHGLDGQLKRNGKRTSFERWEKMVLEVIDKAEQCIIAIETDCGCSEEQLKKLWLYGKTHKE